MSLEQRGPLKQQEIEMFWDEQGQLLDSAGRHALKGCIAGAVTGLAMLVTPGGVVIGLEMVRQFGAAAVDLIKHESNKKEFSIS